MKSVLSGLHSAIKYGAYIIVIIDVIQYAVDAFEKVAKEKGHLNDDSFIQK